MIFSEMFNEPTLPIRMNAPAFLVVFTLRGTDILRMMVEVLLYQMSDESDSGLEDLPAPLSFLWGVARLERTDVIRSLTILGACPT